MDVSDRVQIIVGNRGLVEQSDDDNNAKTIMIVDSDGDEENERRKFQIQM